jgi:hypothetical protein
MLWMILYMAALFVLFTPGIVISVPSRGSPLTVAITHGFLFAIILYFSQKAIWKWAKSQRRSIVV